MNELEIKQVREDFARSGGKAKNGKMSPEARVKHAKMMVKARIAKKNKAKKK